MGGIFKKIDKAAGKLIGIDKDAAKKAANAQAKAYTDSADMVAKDNRAAAAASQAAIEADRAQEIARQSATDLLGKPMQTATVDLSDASAEEEDDLLTRRGSRRNAYRSTSGGNTGLVL